MRRVLRAGDLDDPPVGKAGIERVDRLAEGRQAVATEQLEDRLADTAQRLERRRRIQLGVELADDRRGRRHPQRPDRDPVR